ncbi:MAG: SUMF1/EgtB/PvdO family nonheme iron enzyme, partial [Myxococcota bacterium]|nr:SUMF1/EgtB/PvdO family nonheme iron enzyme [Myxococcota bacterium]
MDKESLSVATLSRAYDFSTTEVTRHLYGNVIKSADEAGKRCPLCPMDRVSWTEAIAFANALSKREGLSPAYTIEGDRVTWDVESKGYRLPTSAEWERASQVLDWSMDKENAPSRFVGPDSMRGGVAEWVWDSFEDISPREASRKNRVKWQPPSEDPGAESRPPHHPDCLPGGTLVGPDFPGGAGFASSVAGQESSRAPLGRKRAISVEAPGPSDVGAVVTIRHGRTDKLRRKLTGHTNTQVFARALQSAWILSYAVDGELRLWDPRKGQQVASDRYLGGDLSPQGDPGGNIYVTQAGKGKIAVMSPRFLTLWHWGRNNPRAKPFLDLVPPAWDPAVIGGMLGGPEGRLASVKGTVVTVWNNTGKELAKLDSHQGAV